MVKRTVTAAVPVLGLLVLTACSSVAVGGTARPAGGSDGLPPGVPHVPEALDTAKFQQDPCDALTAAQLRAFGVAAQGEVGEERAPTCDWSDSRGPSKTNLSVTIATDRDGLASVYRNRAEFKRFEPVEVEGYPGVLLGGEEVLRGQCDAEVAVTDRLSFSVNITFNRVDRPADFDNPCARAKVVAGEVLKTLKGGA
ncbi:DUF3558 domain-containing protein [Streptoalloteichus hindustanus]|uniref:DUF3558 domain-containing protein n=1 Tax=Streptoalloteichus hindustanus TaxID=2017 RepID=A0A1M5KCX4_STRHI|nr:DUF3558 domain-containing protein [Streptoalloteichus hindustanus]SHG50794.1 Protein of unknown function [Streptoalloteichus hindustanus]